MKLPAVWIVAALAAGVLLAGLPGLAFLEPIAWLSLAFATLLAGILFLRRERLSFAWAVALLAWALLGGAAARLEQISVPPNHVASLVAAGKLDLSEALRWRGRLRENPVRLPWGNRYEVDLEEVEVAGRAMPVAGGLRLSYFGNRRSDAETAPALRAGDRVEALVRARVPRNFGNPGAFDYRGHLARQGVDLTGSLRSLELLQKIGAPRPAPAHRLARLRARLLDQLDALFAASPDRAAILRAMLLGDRSFVERDQVLAFQKSAVYHVLVIAGLHVAALAAFVLWVGRRLRLPLTATTLLTFLVLGAYVSILEDRPPILRAALMAAVFLSARFLFRHVELLNTTAVAALVLLAARPSVLLDPSFQLSFLAVATIGALAIPWFRRTSETYLRALRDVDDVTRDATYPPRTAQFRLDLRAFAAWLSRKLPQRLASHASSLVTAPCTGALRLWEVMVLSAAIQLGMLPLLAHYFHRVSLSGPFANVPAVLLTGLIIPLGFLTLALGSLWTAPGALLAKPLGGLVGALVASVEWFARWGGSSYRIPGPPALLLLSFFAAMILLAVAARRARRCWQFVAAVPLAALALAVAAYPFAPRLQAGKLEVTVLDVGQGDSILVAYPGGQTMLIDGGGSYGASRVGGMRTGIDVGEEVVSPYLWTRGLKQLDVVALTHAHGDHLDGLVAVLENFRVRELWVGRDVASPGYQHLLEHARMRGVRVVHRVRGESFAWDSVNGRVLWPESSEEAASAKNNDSLVLRLGYANEELLLPGDIERAVERKLVADGDALSAEFLKVAHHGSKTSTSAEWLARVTPRVAAISVGDTNPFGHPSAEVLDRLREAGVRVLRTDRDGAITVLADGNGLAVRSYLGDRRH